MRSPIPTLDELYAAHAQEVFRHIHLRYHIPYEDAEDLTHDVFLKAARALASLEGDHIRSWLFRVAHTTAMDYYRSRSMRQRCAPSQSLQALQSEYESLASGEDMQASSLTHLSFQDAFSRLTLQQQRVLIYVASGWSVQEIATALSRTPSNVRSIIMRARIALRQQYQQVQEGGITR
jgi:RNA polymerase sigma-70 factor, ECF subfamily